MLVLVAHSQASPLTLDTLKSKLKRKNATWTAGETSISRLSPTEQKLRLGAELPEGFDDFFRGEPAIREAHPASWDWRNVNGVNYAAPILNQASCGSCVAFSAVSTLETQMNITRNSPSSPWAFSPQHLFSCGGGSCNSGWTMYGALGFMKDQGVPDESCFPYSSGANGLDLACSLTCTDAKPRSEKIVGYTAPTLFMLSIDAVKAALQKGPLMAVMRVYEDFLFYKGGVYKHSTGAMAGGHAVSIEGWSDADRAWIVRNSWGEDWGEKGYFRIVWDDVSGVGSQTFLLTVPTSNGYVAVKGLRDNTVLNGTMDLVLESTYPGTKTTALSLKRKGEAGWWGNSLTAGRTPFDTTQFKDGSYALVARAEHASGIGESQPRRVHILNGPFTGSLAFANLTDGQSVTGQQTLQIQLNYQPVPFTKITFRAKHLQTGEETVRTTYNCLPQIQFLWRAQLVAKGPYELTLEGQVGSVTKVQSAPIRVTVN